MVLTPGSTLGCNAPSADSTLIKVLARAFRWRWMLETGRHTTIDELAAAKSINGSHVCRILRLTLLAPDIVEAILDGRQPEGLTLPGLVGGVSGGATRTRTIRLQNFILSNIFVLFTVAPFRTFSGCSNA